MQTSSRPSVPRALPAVMLVGATGVMSIGAAIGSLAPSLRNAPWTDDPRLASVTIAGNPTAYAWANGLFLAAALLTAFGLVPLALRFDDSGRAWAWIGAMAFGFAAMFSSIARIVSIRVFTLAGQPGFDVSDPTAQAFIRLDDGLGFMFGLLGFLAILLFGIALTQTPGANGVGWIFVLGGGLGLALRLFGGVIPAMIYLETAALGATTWALNVPSPLPRGQPTRRNLPTG